MTRLAIHHQAALTRSHAEIADAVSRQQPETPTIAFNPEGRHPLQTLIIDQRL